MAKQPFSALALELPGRSAVDNKRSARRSWALWFLFMLGITGLVGSLMIKYLTNPVAIIAWMIYIAAVVLVIREPMYGIYIIGFFAFIGDRYLSIWYPFLTNFSSQENLIFINRQVIFSPFEALLVLIYLSWLVRLVILHKVRFYKSELLLPLLTFVGFLIFGFVYGVIKKGNTNIALWEIRPIMYMPAMFVLTSNLLTRRDQVNKLMWLIMVAIFIKCMFGAVYVVDVLKFNISKVNEITEHTGSILMDAFFVYTISVFLFRNSGLKRLLLPLMSVVVVITFVATQRRSAFVALFFAFAMIALILYREKKTLFWMIIPPATVLFIIYAGIFWNSSSSIALPIRAIKSQLTPNQISERDRASDSYRIAENYDLYSTIRRTPIFGTGFGHMFDMVVPLPDISFFVWWRYITHNSILWVWANIGVGGFLAMLIFVGMTIMTGVRVLFRMPEGALKSAAFTATLYMVMHFLFAYVDMSWDNQSMIMMGIMSGLIGCLEYIVAQPVARQSRRWPWQAEPESLPSLLPFPGIK